MGTNFYWLQEACPTCGYVEDRMDPEIHIGKRSAAGLYRNMSGGKALLGES